MKKLLVILLLLSPFVSHATELLSYPKPQPSVFDKIVLALRTCNIDFLCYFSAKLGSTITTISSSTVVADFPTIYNANNTNLNTDKLESGSTASTLTITTGTIGTLTLTNPLTVANGGTASTTLSSNQILLGNGTSLIKTVSGWGTSGQFLTSNGGVLAPTWTTSSVDLAIAYAWTGVHNFVGSATYIKNLTASSTLIFDNGGAPLSYIFPTTRGSSGQVLTENGSGTLSFATTSHTNLLQDGTLYSTGSTASTTVKSVTIPPNTLTTASHIRVQANWNQYVNAGYAEIGFGNGSATTSMIVGTNSGSFLVNIYATSTSAQSTNGIFFKANGVEGYQALSFGQAANRNTPYSTTAPLYISFIARHDTSGGATGYSGISVEVLK